MQHYALEGDTRTKNTIVTSAITINIKVKKRNKTKKEILELLMQMATVKKKQCHTIFQNIIKIILFIGNFEKISFL